MHTYLAKLARTESTEEAAAWLEEAVKSLRYALRHYGLDSVLRGQRLTPNAALIRLQGTDKLTISAVERRRTELLTSHGLQVIAVLPARGEIVIMIARDQREILRLAGLWLRRQLPESAPLSNASFLLGAREDSGELFYLNLGGEFAGQPQHGPHTLIAGETGSGKGVLIENLLLDICATNTPRDARIRLIDPKSGVDYPWLRGMPHVDGDIVTTQDGAVTTFRELAEEMERRYRFIERAGARTIDSYNRKVGEAERLPRIYLVHDEIGDWMADKDHPDYREAVDSYVERLPSKARAAGIPFLLITQRPDREAMPGRIKANMNNKLCLRVSTRVNSEIVLDESGAERLLGRGHLAAKLANERAMGEVGYVLLQVPFADEDECDDLAIRTCASERTSVAQAA